MQAEPAKAPYEIDNGTKLLAGLFLVGALALVGGIVAAAFLLGSFGGCSRAGCPRRRWCP